MGVVGKESMVTVRVMGKGSMIAQLACVQSTVAWGTRLVDGCGFTFIALSVEIAPWKFKSHVSIEPVIHWHQTNV